jgi:very-short-patch-repair endonuclease
MKRESHTARARALAEHQHGLIARRQLLSLGVPQRTITSWISLGILIRVVPRVYSLEHRDATVERDLLGAILYAGPGAMLSHATAAWWRGLIDHRPCGPIEVSTPRHVRSLNGLRVYGRREVERTVYRGVPITGPAQTVLDLAATQEMRLLRRALAVLDYRRELDLETLDALSGRGRPGSAPLRRALGIHQPRLAYTNGRFEEDFVHLCERFRVPIPRVNVYVHGVLVDAYWPRDALVVELDGGRNHSTRAQRRVDKRKELTLREHGITVVRYDWDLLHDEPKRICRDLTRQLPRTLSANRQKAAGSGTKLTRRTAGG